MPLCLHPSMFFQNSPGFTGNVSETQADSGPEALFRAPGEESKSSIQKRKGFDVRKTKESQELKGKGEELKNSPAASVLFSSFTPTLLALLRHCCWVSSLKSRKDGAISGCFVVVIQHQSPWLDSEAALHASIFFLKFIFIHSLRISCLHMIYVSHIHLLAPPQLL